jgi:hypothetical protein
MSNTRLGSGRSMSTGLRLLCSVTADGATRSPK